MTSLRDKTLSGMFWSLLQNAGGRGITFFITLVLARLLSPKEFGLIGMLTIFIQVSQTLIYGGFNQALIQKKNADDEDYSSVFYINLLVSGILYLIIFFSAPAIASFYEQPILTSLIRVLSIVFIVNAFSYVQESHLTKTLQFKKLMLVNLPSTILGGIVSIFMAGMGFGVWSIVALQLTTRIAYAIQIWIYSKWKPLLSFNSRKATQLFSFGSRLMVSGVIDSVYKNIYLVIIGKFFPLASVGYYQNANNLVQYPTSTFSMAFGKVAFPILSTIQDDNRKLKVGYRKINQQVLYWICPAFVLAGVLAEPLFRFLFTEKWLPAVPYFQMLCIVGVLFPRYIFDRNIINVKGRSDVILRLTIVEKVITTISIIIAVPYGITALLIAQVINAFVAYYLYSYYSGSFIQYTLKEQTKDILLIIMLNIIVGGVVFGINQLLPTASDLIRLLLGVSIGCSLYWIGSKYFYLAPYLEFKHIAQSKLKHFLANRTHFFSQNYWK